jgi:hypothetical protein
VAGDAHLAGVGADERGQDLDDGGLAGAIGTEQREGRTAAPDPPGGAGQAAVRPGGRRRSAGGSGRRCDPSGTSAAERWIIMRESSGYPTADNPTSTAFGLGQLLLGNRILYLGQAYATTDCGRPLGAFRAYVRDRYGTAARAKAFWQANGWY